MNILLMTAKRRKIMKGKAFWVATCSAIIFVFCISTLSFAGGELWPKKEGELCFNAYQHYPIVPTDNPDGLVRLWAMNTGNNHYLVHGSNTEPHPDYPPSTPEPVSIQLFNGNAIVYIDNILMHISSSGYDATEVRGWLGTIDLDSDALVGPFQGVGINFPIGSPPGSGYVTYDGIQTLEYTTCP
jgi:hypothetical protein